MWHQNLWEKLILLVFQWPDLFLYFSMPLLNQAVLLIFKSSFRESWAHFCVYLHKENITEYRRSIIFKKCIAFNRHYKNTMFWSVKWNYRWNYTLSPPACLPSVGVTQKLSLASFLALAKKKSETNRWSAGAAAIHPALYGFEFITQSPFRALQTVLSRSIIYSNIQ